MKSIDIFPWNDHFNTGISTIDEQHRKLVVILNRLASHVAYSDHDDDLNDIFDELIDYTVYHFKTEEAIWLKHLSNDSLHVEHEQVHQNFVNTVLKLKSEQGTQSLSELAQEALGFLASWLASHILETDRHMAYIVFALEDGLELDMAKEQADKRMSGSTRVFIDIILSIYNTLSSNTVDLMRELKLGKTYQEKISMQEHYQRAILDNFPFLVWLKDEESRFLAINKSMADNCGYDSSEALIGKTEYDIFPKELAEKHRKDDEQVLTQGKSKIVEEVVETKEDKRWIETYKSPVNIDGKIIGTVGFSKDITDRKRLERNLTKERDLFKQYLDTVEAIIISLDVDGYVNLVNRKACEIFGYSAEQIIGQNWFDFCLEQPEGKKVVYQAFLDIMSGNLEKYEYFENYIVTASKKKHLIAWHNSFLLDEDNKIIGTLSSGEDLTLLKEQQRNLDHMAHYDILTSLPNRILLSKKLTQAMYQSQLQKDYLAVICLDLDNFKNVNDAFGHDKGDDLLKVLASRIKKLLKDGDTVARLGGDEFGIVLSGIKNKEDSFIIIQQILNTISKPITSKEVLMQISASSGVTFYSYEDNIDADQLLRQADQAMYQAKISGKNGFHIFDVQKDDHIRSQYENLKTIEAALENKEFAMYYQPKVNMRCGKVLGAEALIRWNHPELGLQSPALFLPIIENHYLSIDLGYWVINNVMQQIVEWKKQGLNIVVSINISPMQLQDTNFMTKLAYLLELNPEINSNDFEFEILESSALEDLKHATHIINECKKIGIAFLLDDFGTGYSSLTYLKSLPAKQLKIDQSFVNNMLECTDDMAILEGIIGLANAFRRGVIAEGVESAEQGDMLLRLGCEEAQGYFIAKPMPSEELKGWIDRWEPPSHWKEIKTVSRDDLPLLYVITEHNIWIRDVINFINKDQVESPILGHKECRFGTWFYSIDMKDYEKKDIFIELGRLHQEIHEVINKNIKLNEENQFKDRSASIKEIKDYHETFIKTFEKFIFA